MLQDMALFLMTSRFSIAISQNLSGMAGFFQRHFAGTDNLRMVSIILLLLAFILFLFLIVILYIKSLLSFIKNEGASMAQTQSAKKVKQDSDMERELEKELEREIEKAQEQKRVAELQKREQAQLERQLATKAEKDLKGRTLRKTESEKLAVIAPVPHSELSNLAHVPLASQAKSSLQSRGNASAMEFDWRKGRTGELDAAAAGITAFQYVPAQKPLNSMTGLMLNMLGRNIDEGKIAQTVKSKCGELAGEEEIIQVIDSVKNFVSLCNNGKFANLPNSDELPPSDEALYNLAQGDPTYALAMMESLMNNNIDKCQQMKMTQKRDITFLETSNYACTFGTLASLNDVQLATNAFELAIELSPKNVNAWSRAGDMYEKAESESKAIWAYQNVINMGDEDLYPHQVANANKHLSQYYYNQGDSLKAAKLYNSSNDYYTAIGINQDLTAREHEIINIIESKQADDLPETISKLLNLSSQRQRGYV